MTTTVLDTTGSPAGADAGCGLKPAALPRAKPMSVNGVPISRQAVARETQNHPAAKPVEAWLAAARALVVRELLLQEARRLGIAPEAISDEAGRRETEEEALIRGLIEKEVTTPEPDEATCRRVYEQNRARLRSDDLYAVRHILIAAPPADAEARADARRKAQAIIAAVAADPASFAAHAAAQSACPSSTCGGNLGQISRGQTVPEFETALATAPVGRVCPAVVESRYGMHVVIVDHRMEGVELPFEVARPRIAAWLLAKAQHAAVRAYISMLAGRADIQGIDLPAH